MPRILLVEDNEMNRDMLSRRLERRGYEVVIATDGSEAVARAQADHPDLILMDLSLPLLDGWEAARRIKAMPDIQAVPILGLTAHAMSGDRQRALAAGCDDFDTKPVEMPRLLEKVRRLLERASLRPGPGAVEIVRPAARDSLADIRRFIERSCAEHGVGGEARDALVLATDEACANVAIHGYAGRDPDIITVSFERRGDRAVVTVTDRGRSFEPTAAPTPDTTLSHEMRRIGGLGLHLIRKAVDHVTYDPGPDGNRLTLVKLLHDTPPTSEDGPPVRHSP